MRTITFILSIAFLISFFTGYSQLKGFPFGSFLHSELDMRTYEKDTTAAAVVLNEFGYAYIDNQTFNLLFEYHVKIKILKSDGLSQGNFSIPLYKGQGGKIELLREIKATTFNKVNGRVEETPIDAKNVYSENMSKNLDAKKLALPGVRVGSVIEVLYTIESPYIYNFRRWDFQADIPKIQSEFWAQIPANYIYNIVLKGPLSLSKNESSVVEKCVARGSAYANCALLKYGMKNIPAFHEEDYMTARSNFLSSINFELSEIHHFDGQIDKITREWKDAEQELRRDSRFGLQLKKGKEIGQRLLPLIAGITDEKEKAVIVYNFIKSSYRWNGVHTFLSESGIRKAFDQKTGDVGDINLSLIAALNFAGLIAEPLLLSTRANGLPTELHPVLSDFNYVVAKVNIGEQVYLLDATDPYLMFGMLPEKCFNGKGRVFGEKGSYWYDLTPRHRSRNLTMFDLTLHSSGSFVGKLERIFEGYESVNQRKHLTGFNTYEEYVADLRKKLGQIQVNNFEITGADDFEGPIKESFAITLEGFDRLDQTTLLINPFFANRIERNPFQSKERHYPIDFAIPFEKTMVLNLTYPDSYELVGAPERNAVALPQGGGKFLFEITNMGNRLTLNYVLSISKSVYNPVEYQYLKELYSRIIQVQNGDLILSRK